MTSAIAIGLSQDNGGGAVSPVVAGKNVVINGALDVWQRNTSFPTLGGLIYTADRWQAYSASNAISVYRQTSGLTGIMYNARVQRNSGTTSTAVNYFAQSLESKDSIRFANQPVTFSFYARAGANFSSASNALAVGLTSGTGTDENWYNGYAGYSNFIVGTATLTTSWQRFTFTGTAPSNTNELAIYFSNTPVGTAGANDYFEITGIQVEQGLTVTPFSRAGGTYQNELAACQRYYQKTYSQGTNPGVTLRQGAIGIIPAGVGGEGMGHHPFPVVMRTTPSYTFYSTNTGASGNIYNASANADVSIGAPNQINDSSYIGFNGGYTTGSIYYWHHTLSAEL
jgi:hypothetical protein